MLFWKSEFRDRNFTLDYEAFTKQSEIMGRNLFNYLQLPWDQQYLDGKKKKRPVKTALQLQVKKGIYIKGSKSSLLKLIGL